ncbi:S8 family peptidase [Microbulbifer halophilus]|uniref:S8 family serine peptidase n=1 Tax=Microbulbifer halophilus TaxID=453963 RepID=A0ABW5EE30_9GAMM|nr:S8 family peptidase [Microbulbifer halophilus]MCW8126382.1 S8 family peptidase [Microbulbifer halophilus]
MPSPMKLICHLLFVTLLLALGACGGGSSSSPSAESGDGGGSDGGGDGGSGDTGGDSGHRLSGSVYTARFSDTDSDSNDPQAPAESNNTHAEAQSLGNPVLLGGFASAAEDADDWYRLSLPESQSIRLTVHAYKPLSPLENDLDLYLYTADDPETPVDSSTGVLDDSESLDTGAGDYLLRVEAVSGASGYTLWVDSNYDHSDRSPSVSDDFAPGELIVQWKGKSDPRALEQLDLLPTADTLPDLPHRYRLTDTTVPKSLRQTFPGADPQTLQKLRTLRKLKALQVNPAVEYAEPDYRYRRQTDPEDPQYDSALQNDQWHYGNIDLPTAWDITTGSSGVAVAILDTGIFSGHPDLDGKQVDGYDFISDTDSAGDGDGMDSDPEDDSGSWHGTHVAGTVGAATDNGEGVAGAGWDTRIMPLRVLGAEGGSSYDIAQAVRYAAGLDNDSGEPTTQTQKADVINMSFGGPGFSRTLQDALSAARDAGVILVAAAGNDNSDTPAYPAAMEGVIAVSATGADDQKAPYSNFGDWVDLAAPGGDLSADANGDGFSDGVYSTYVNDSGSADYDSLQGTSMASPHAAAVFALMRDANPQLTPDDLDALLANGQLTQDKGDPGRDPVYGHGLLDAYKSVQAANKGATQPVIAADPETLDFANVDTMLSVEIRNIGADGASVADTPQAGAGWITGVEAVDVDHNGFGSYRVDVDRSGLADGSHSSEVVFPISGADDFRLPVELRVGAGNSGYHAGYLYIRLLKPADGGGYETVQQLARSTDNGEYPFEFTGLESGDYAIAAGSDLNGNGSICDAGEACGLYPDNGEKSFAVDGDRQDLDFVAGYPNDGD